MLVHFEDLCREVAARLEAAGIPENQARLEARVMAEADLQEVPSHGVRMLPSLLTALAEGRVAAVPTFSVVRDFAATCVLDCGNGPGRCGAIRAMDQAMARARNFGAGICLARNTSHWGRAHAYASHAAQAGFIGICTTNGIPTMIIGGAKTRTIGNNPLAIGIPHSSAQEPVVLDMAMSQAAMGKVATWLREGRPVPANWGLDADGKPSTSAQDILQGAVLPTGEHKGAALALMMELLTAALAGAAFSHQLQALDQSGVDPHASKLFIALNVEAFADRMTFAQQVTEYLAHLSQWAAPFRYPGERGWQARRRNLAAGVPLHETIVEQLADAGVSLSPL